MKTTGTFILLSIAFFGAACNSGQFDKESFSAANDTESVTGLSGDSVKLVKKAQIDFKVKDVRETTRDIVHTAKLLEGLVTRRKMESVERETKNLSISEDSVKVITSYVLKGDLTVRIPVKNMDAFIEHIADSALFIQQIDVETEDRSLPYLSLQMKQENAEKLPDSGSKVRNTAEALSIVTSRDEIIDKQIAARQILADQKYSTIHLNFFQNPLVKTEIVADHSLSGYTLPFSTSMKNAFIDGWHYFVGFIIGVAHFWMFILVAVGITFGYRYYKMRKATSS